MLYGNEPFALIFLKNNKISGIDLDRFRPDPKLYLDKYKSYDAIISKNYIKIDGRNYILKT